MRRFIYILIVFLTSGICFTSCRSPQYVPVESVKHDSIYISKILHDSIYQRDSIYIDRKGDTVFIYKDRYLYKYKNLIDTMYINRIDSIQVPYPVEKQLTKWQSMKLELGGWALGIIIVFILVLIGRYVKQKMR